jgi:outer membrane protein insertion porin family
MFSFAQALEDIGPRTDYFKIDRIEVSGLKKVEKEAVLERLGVKPDMVLDNYVLKKDLEKIYSMKYFDTVEAHQEVDEKDKKNVLLMEMTV